MTKAHNEAKRWLHRYRKSDIKDSIYGMVLRSLFFSITLTVAPMWWSTSERDVTSLQAVIYCSIYDLRFCLEGKEKERERERGGGRSREHCKIDDDWNWPFVIFHYGTISPTKMNSASCIEFHGYMSSRTRREIF